jgi:hypothetical protein
VLARLPSCRSTASRNAQPSAKPAIVITPLAVGQTATLEAIPWTIRGHAVVEVAQVNARFDYHDYQLESADNVRARLMLGHTGKPGEWMLFAPMEPDALITPIVAASMRTGQIVKLGYALATVERMFQTTGIASHLHSPAAVGEVRFNLTARQGTSVFLVSWNTQGITFYRGTLLPEKVVTAAFKAGTAKAP